MWNKTKITELLRIKYPILLGPMGGNFSTPELLAAVTNAGGLGSLGAYTLPAEEILQMDKEIRKKTSGPYNINLWVSDVDEGLDTYSSDKQDNVVLMFKPFFDELGLPLPELNAHIPSKFAAQVEAVFEIRPAVFSFVFGIPSREILEECRKLGIVTVGAATTLEEGFALEEAKVDAIVASGFEAGGHKPSFLRPAEESFTGTFALVQQLKARLKTPVIAAGGIVDGKGIAAALTLGADAVQIGTAFLATDESNATAPHKAKLLSNDNHYTVVSKSLTGRMGRMIPNSISNAIGNEKEVLPFPLQNRFIAALKSAAMEQGRTDLINFWSGQNHTALKHSKATELMQALIIETGNILP